MTTATFFSEGSRIVGFEIKGHTGHAPAGEDIVCAAVTSAVGSPSAPSTMCWGWRPR